MMRTTAVVLFFTAICAILGFTNISEKWDTESEYKKRGVIKYIDRVWYVRGVPELSKGSKVNISLYSDRISINDDVIIPLDKIMLVKDFKINELRMTDSLWISKVQLGSNWLVRIWALIYCLRNINVRHFLSIEFLNDKGQECKGLFVSGGRPATKTFVEVVNRQIGADLCLQKGVNSA